jgi:hypothetical protein
VNEIGPVDEPKLPAPDARITLGLEFNFIEKEPLEGEDKPSP